MQCQGHNTLPPSTISICGALSSVCKLLPGPAMVAPPRYTKYWRSVSMMPENPATMSLYSRAPVTTILEDWSSISYSGQRPPPFSHSYRAHTPKNMQYAHRTLKINKTIGELSGRKMRPGKIEGCLCVRRDPFTHANPHSVTHATPRIHSRNTTHSHM